MITLLKEITYGITPYKSSPMGCGNPMVLVFIIPMNNSLDNILYIAAGMTIVSGIISFFREKLNKK